MMVIHTGTFSVAHTPVYLFIYLFTTFLHLGLFRNFSGVYFLDSVHQS